MRFVSHALHHPEVSPWTVGVMAIRGTDFFYGLGVGDSFAAANLTPSSFRLPEA